MKKKPRAKEKKITQKPVTNQGFKPLVKKLKSIFKFILLLARL